MASPSSAPAPDPAQTDAPVLGSATYEVIRQRLATQGEDLRARIHQLNAARQDVFGAIESKLLRSDRITTSHNCLPRDMVQVGDGCFLFGFNVHLGLKQEPAPTDIFALYRRDNETGAFKEQPLELMEDKAFQTDFARLHQVYVKAQFTKFSVVERDLYAVFQIGSGASDISVFKWTWTRGGLQYVDGRSESEYRRVGFPPTHEFRWQTPTRDAYRYGTHPHVSIEDRVFVECVGGTLTVKVEDNTDTGEGIFNEPVDEPNQKVDDAEISYALVEHVIVLRIRPYKEKQSRFLVFNEKQQTVVRVDSIGQSCALLPEAHGLIFPDGYYLATGELKRFDSREKDLVLERVIHAPNGEDSLYVFYGRGSGDYVLLPYRLIEQKVEERIACHGFSLFPDGQLVLFRAESEPQKHHTIQLRQTPFHEPGREPPGRRDTHLYQVGNKEVVRCLAECHEVLSLALREQPYPDLYADVVKRCVAIADAYPWIRHPEAGGLEGALRQVRETAERAVEEFDKVRRLQREAQQRVAELRRRVEEQLQVVRRSGFRTLDEFVQSLGALRQLRGEVITARDGQYVDSPALDRLEATLVGQTEELGQRCVGFLLQPAALEPYRRKADDFLSGVEQVAKTADGRKLEKAAATVGTELELLTEVVNGLKIQDATEATRIIDGITAIYATLNQVRAALKNRLQSLGAAESAAQFAAQMKLVSQSAGSYLEVADSPAKCEAYLSRLSVQLEEIEGAFADYEEFAVQIAEKRTALYEAFEQRKVVLVEQRSRKTTALFSAAERVLKSVQHRLATLTSVEAINAYVASDLMAAKVRDIVGQLLALEDTVKADDLLSRLKSAQQDAIRQLKDRQDLFQGGDGLIQLGRHRFNVNAQPLELTVVNREGLPHLHLTSTKFFEPIADPAYLATRDAWEQETAAESPALYRAEYLAMKWLQAAASPAAIAETAAEPEPARLSRIQEFMADRHDEGYAKGVHDMDAARILGVLAAAHIGLGAARFHPAARGCAVVYWQRFCPPPVRSLWDAKLAAFSARNRVFQSAPAQTRYIAELQRLLRDFASETALYPADLADEAGEYLFVELTQGRPFSLTREAEELIRGFRAHLTQKGSEREFLAARETLQEHPASELELVRDWLAAFVETAPGTAGYLEEAAAFVFGGEGTPRAPVSAPAATSLSGMKGSHPRLSQGVYAFDYLDLKSRFERHEREVVPRFVAYHRQKDDLLARERTKLRLAEFRPRVLTSFVRNQLIDEVYLPLVGDNLAKQIGAAGAGKRTDLMGLLLLISPPGYGKTTLLEYVAARLGLIFVKINGPALGHTVTSLDPEEAPNASAREELHRLNLALEMGDNVMLCVDDIQHCSPEFLQRFISLCDGQRKIEGVWRAQPRTYDLRGRKVVVVMAGNPYTESGQKFKIPDMLANRADTYNLGDIIGGSEAWFKASYLENAVTSNPVLAPLANKSQKDIRVFIRAATTGERLLEGLEASYAAPEVEEILSVLTKLVRVRDIVLRVNQEYIHSAAQADEFRTEPAFRLQGSYRNMNRLAEKIVPIMDENEVRALVMDHYRGESQTLTTGAEANFLKLKELLGVQSPAEKVRWEEIKTTFRRQQLVRGTDQNDPIGRVVGQLTAFHASLQGIQQTLEQRLGGGAALKVDLSSLTEAIGGLKASAAAAAVPAPTAAAPIDRAPVEGVSPALLRSTLQELASTLREMSDRGDNAPTTRKIDLLWHEVEAIRTTLARLKALTDQRSQYLDNAGQMLAARAKEGTFAIELTQEMLTNERAFLESFQRAFTAGPPPEDNAPPQA